MTTNLIVAVLYQRLDLLDYAESLLEKIKMGNKDMETEKELIHVVNRLRTLRGRIESIVQSVEGEDGKTLISYYVNISNPKEIEILTDIRNIGIGDETFRSELDLDIKRLVDLREKLG